MERSQEALREFGAITRRRDRDRDNRKRRRTT
jgi:hypothetical protein